MTAEEIYAYLKAQIEGVKLIAGAKCPSESQLQDQFGAARGTVRAALKRLAHEGYLEVSQGRQRTVRLPEPEPLAPLRLLPEEDRPLPFRKIRSAAGEYTASFGEHLMQLGQQRGWEPSDQVLVSPREVLCGDLKEVPRLVTSEIATSLGIRRERDRVIWFLRRRSGGQLPLVLQWAIVPLRVISAIDYDDLKPGGLTKLYRERWGIRRAYADAHYRPVAATRDEAKSLRVERDSPLIEERRISFFWRVRKNHSKGGSFVPYEFLLSLYTDRVSLDFSWMDET